jgi:nucleoside-diphosphate-sugar epimerase
MFKNILITGGAGYVGSMLSENLINKGYNVKVYDTFYFGKDHLPKSEKLTLIDADIRNTEKFKEECSGVDVVIHLACISNDPSFELDENLSKSINFDCFETMVIAAKQSNVKRFIYASSSSVYGVSDQDNVTEDHDLVPLTLYNKFKGMCEPLLLKHVDDDFNGVIIRPATVCGYSSRCRLDLSVNILTNLAIRNKKITVFGGEQRRPNLNIKDMCRLYELLLNVEDDLIKKEIFNVGYQNNTIMKLASIVKSRVQSNMKVDNIEIEVSESNDKRSYHINSDKIFNKIGFKPIYTIEDAVDSICEAFKLGKLNHSLENTIYSNVKTMQKLNVK